MTDPLTTQFRGNYNLVRVAALSGAAAVCLAAYGRHSMKDTPETREYMKIYESANQMHLLHSVALLATPFTKRPVVVRNNAYSDVIFYLHCTISKICIFSDWSSFHHRYVTIQRHMLLQSNKEIKRWKSRSCSSSIGTIRRRLFNSWMVEHVILKFKFFTFAFHIMFMKMKPRSAYFYNNLLWSCI